MDYSNNKIWEETHKMKVFISWSGHKSFEVAKVLKEWIPCIIQEIEPYFSSEDIDKGARWSTDIAKELEEASFGILCVTKENLESQWLNFEAGALSKAMDKARVCPFLFDLQPSDISKSPILQFQMTSVDRDDIFKLFKSMNSCLEENKLEDNRLEKMFSAFWPKMDEAFKTIETENDKSVINKEEDKENHKEILEEMLDLLRTHQMILTNPERILPREYLENIIKDNKSTMQRVQEAIPREFILDLRNAEDELVSYLNIVHNHKDVADIEHLEICVNRYLQTSKRIFRMFGLRRPMLRIMNRENED